MKELINHNDVTQAMIRIVAAYRAGQEMKDKDLKIVADYITQQESLQSSYEFTKERNDILTKNLENSNKQLNLYKKYFAYMEGEITFKQLGFEDLKRSIKEIHTEYREV